MKLIKSNINFKIELYKNEGVQDFENDIFPSQFCLTICGKPGSGKTTLLKFLIKSNKFFGKKYDYIYIISPSFCEYDNLLLPDDNFTNSLNWLWIKDKIDKINSRHSEYMNVLFIFDDIISELYNSRYSKEIGQFIFNRRHLLLNGMISIILTSQKFTRIPTEIRSCSNIIIFFKLNSMCLKKIYEDLVFVDKEIYEEVVNKIFTETPNCFLIYRICNNNFYKNFDKVII
jgi:energy-coupling factor transporter ATP-binding protein EcfA2